MMIDVDFHRSKVRYINDAVSHIEAITKACDSAISELESNQSKSATEFIKQIREIKADLIKKKVSLSEIGKLIVSEANKIRQQEEEEARKASLPNIGNYSGYSIVDALASSGNEYSYAYRKDLAQSMGEDNYTGSAEQNIDMLNELKKNSR